MLGVALALAGFGASPAPAGSASAWPAGINPDSATIPQLEHAMDAGTLSSVALTDFYLHRIGQLNPLLHAVITVNPDALALARASDAARRSGHVRSPLEGIPVLLKDNIGTGDREPTTAGSLALVNAKSPDAFLVTKLRAAGAVILGKTNLSEWANFRSTQSTSGWSAVGGVVNNPYALDHNACGSSSGSAAAAAADLATVTVGTETDGSIVCPSSANGDVGLKPSVGVISRTGIVPISHEQDTAGPITRNVTDAAVLLGVLQGMDPADPATAAAQGHTFSDYTRFLNADALRGARLGIWRAGNEGLNSDTDTIFSNAVGELRSLGATVVDPVVPPGLNDIGGPENTALQCEFKHDINAYLAALPGSHPADLAGLIAFDNANAAREMPFFGQEIFQMAQATQPGSTACVTARQQATALAQNSINALIKGDHLDAIVAVTGSPAWQTDLVLGDHGIIGTSTPAAVAGYPDITVPAGSAFDLPVGISFMGPQWSEPEMIALAYSFEQGTHARHAPRFLPTTPTTDGVNPRPPGSPGTGQVTAPDGGTGTPSLPPASTVVTRTPYGRLF
ncbi:MAG: amidase [Streptosporangiaceae bacterium]|nr:amidase [Streptosporangiaceae bacterium]